MDPDNQDQIYYNYVDTVGPLIKNINTTDQSQKNKVLLADGNKV